MKKIYKKGVLFVLLWTQIEAHEEQIDRSGFSFGMGMNVIAGCEKDDIYDEESNIVDTDTYCGALPFVNLSLGYGITPQTKLNLELKTLIFAGALELKTQYYVENREDTIYWYGGAGVLYAVGHGADTWAVGDLGVGYAKGHTEYEIGIMKTSGSQAPMLTLGIKYAF